MRVRGSLLISLVIVLAVASSAAARTPSSSSWGQAWGMRQINMPAAWDITTGDPNVIVAVIDTGVDPNMPDLKGALVPGWDFITNTWTTTDVGNHGTYSAIVVGGRGNGGIAGYCWQCKVMPVRITTDGFNINPILAARGIRWAVDHGARVISIGWSDEGANIAGEGNVASAIAYAAQNNVMVIASAGNSASSKLTFPGADPGAYPVASTDPSDAIYWWSAFGKWIHLAMPGCQLGSWTGWVGAAQECGTSASAPALAGLAGLMLSVNPSLTPPQVAAALQKTAVPIAGLGGGGRVDAYRALLAVGGQPPVAPPPPPPPPPPPVVIPPRPKPGSGGPKLKTHVKRGLLQRHWHVAIVVGSGRVGATLRSLKAKSCTVSLRSSNAFWLSGPHVRNSVSLSAKVPAGRYGVDVWCTDVRPSKAALVLRGYFP